MVTIACSRPTSPSRRKREKGKSEDECSRRYLLTSSCAPTPEAKSYVSFYVDRTDRTLWNNEYFRDFLSLVSTKVYIVTSQHYVILRTSCIRLL